MKNVGIIGGGLAGLALACLLAQRGHAVTVYERDKAGGKLRRAEVGGLTFDTGPSLFTFPEVWRTFLARLNEADPLDLQPLAGGLGLTHTPFGAVPLPVPPEHPLFGDWQRYGKAVKPLRPHILTLLTTPPHLTSPEFLRASRALLGVTFPHLTAESWLRSLHLPPALAHALATQALNAGLSPQDAPALYALLPALIAGDVYRPKNSMGAVLDALLAFANARSVQVREGAEIRQVQAPEVHLSGSERVRHDLLVSAIDPQRLARLRGLAAPSPVARRTVSGLAIYAALPQESGLPATSIIPPSDFGAFRQAITAGRLPPDTLALVHAEGRKLALLLTVPALTREMDTAHPWVRTQIDRVGQLLNTHGLLAAAHMVTLSPAHYAAGGHPGGAIYGAAHPVWRGGPLHPQPYRLGRQLWQVGTGVHPGGGVPAVLGGALMVERMVVGWGL